MPEPYEIETRFEIRNLTGGGEGAEIDKLLLLGPVLPMAMLERDLKVSRIFVGDFQSSNTFCALY